MSQIPTIPSFSSEDEERDFWATHDSTDYVEWSKAQDTILSELRPSVRTISIRLPASLLAQIKVLAHKRDVPYQSLIKILLHEAIMDPKIWTRNGGKIKWAKRDENAQAI